MRKPDPSRFTGKKADKLEMKGFSSSLPNKMDPPKQTTREKNPRQIESKPSSKQVSNIDSKQSSNIAILQFDVADIDQLREVAYKAQTFRFSETEVEWIKDTSHSLSKEFKRRKVAQVDILRIALKLFSNALALSKKDILEIIEKMK